MKYQVLLRKIKQISSVCHLLNLPVAQKVLSANFVRGMLIVIP